MNNDKVNKIVQGLGAITAMWMIVYSNFKQQGLNDELALAHTKALMSVAMGGMLENTKEDQLNDPS